VKAADYLGHAVYSWLQDAHPEVPITRVRFIMTPSITGGLAEFDSVPPFWLRVFGSRTTYRVSLNSNRFPDHWSDNHIHQRYVFHELGHTADMKRLGKRGFDQAYQNDPKGMELSADAHKERLFKSFNEHFGGS